MTEVAVLESKLESLSHSVNNQLTGVRSDIKDMTKALRELIRMDSEIKNVTTLVSRIGTEVDDHEKRIRMLENTSVVNSVKIGSGERIYWMLAMVAFNIFTGVVTFMVTN